MNNFITEPKVYLVSRPNVDFEKIAEFLADEELPPAPDSIRAGDDQAAAIVEVSARLCYMSFGRGRREIADFIGNLLRSKDGSVLEHINYGFVATGVSRSLSHELVRHRAGFAYSQRSQRYVDESSCAFVIPPALLAPGMKNARAVFELLADRSAEGYETLSEHLQDTIDPTDFDSPTDARKAVRQATRSVLPNAAETKMFITANVRAWRHFIEMRASPFADVEIRRLAIRILRVLMEESELLFGDFTVRTEPDGSETAVPKYSKV